MQARPNIPSLTGATAAALSDEAQAMINLVAALPSYADMSIEEARARSERSGAAFGSGAPPGRIKTTDTTLQLPHTQLQCRVYTPHHDSTATLSQTLLIYFHGGGWTVGSIESHDGVCQLLAFQNQISVISVAYRLAPEHMFPSAIEDAIASCSFILQQLRIPASSGGGDDAAAAAAAWGVVPNAAVGVGGDSAGATLAAVAAQHLRASLSFQLLVYPFTDGHRANASDVIYSNHVLTPRVIDWFQMQYVGPHPPLQDHRYAPLFSSDFKALPPALVVLAECDPLYDHGIRYAQAIRDAGGEVEVAVAPGALHAFFHLQKFYAAAAAAVMPRIQSWMRGAAWLRRSD